MATRDEDEARRASQKQDSRQSARQGGQKATGGDPADAASQAKSGIGSSQGQDAPSREEQRGGRPSAGTPDIERGAGTHDVERGGTQESLVNASTGAFKERP